MKRVYLLINNIIILFFLFGQPFCQADDFLLTVEEALDQFEEEGLPPPPAGTVPGFADLQENSDLTPEQLEVIPAGPVAEGFSPEPEADDPISAPPSQKTAELNDEEILDVLQIKEMNINDVLKLISEKTGLNIISSKAVRGKVTIYLKDVKLKDALRIILDANDLAYQYEDGIVLVMQAKEFESRYGYVFGGKIETEIHHLLYADGNDMLTLLNQIKSPAGKVMLDAKSNTIILMDAAVKLNVMRQLIKEIDIPVETKVFHLNYATVKDVSSKMDGILTSNVGKIEFDERSNKIIVTDTERKMGEISNLIKAFDVKEKQVLIEAKIIQVILSDQYKFGVDWDAVVSKFHGLSLKSDFDVLSGSDKRGTMSIGTLETDNYAALIQVLEEIGETNILSSPSISSINNQEAKILVGSTEPYVTTTTTNTSGVATTAESVNFIDVGVKLFVTPTIHPDGFITMKIKPEVSSVTKSIKTSNQNEIPVVETSEAETTVMVKDGVTIVIGGLIKDERIDSYNKVPFLGDIPVVGHAFRNSDKFSRKTEIVIFLTPRIISGDVSPADLLPDDMELERTLSSFR